MPADSGVLAANGGAIESCSGLSGDTPALGAQGRVCGNPQEKPKESSLALSQQLKPADAVLGLSETQAPLYWPALSQLTP